MKVFMKMGIFPSVHVNEEIEWLKKDTERSRL